MGAALAFAFHVWYRCLWDRAECTLRTGIDREKGGGVGDIRREGEREQERDGEMCACYLTYDCSDLNNGSGVVQDDHTQRVHLHDSNRQLPHLYPTCCVCARARACVRVESTRVCVCSLSAAATGHRVTAVEAFAHQCRASAAINRHQPSVCSCADLRARICVGAHACN